MLIDENSNNSSTFSIFTNKELEQQNYIKQIDFILEKYNILENDNQLIGSIEKNILFTINYIEHLLIKKENIPSDLENLFLNNYTFKEQINIFVEKKLLNLTKNDSIYFFKDLNIMLHLLSVGTNEKIIESYNNYNLDSLSNLFRFYETKLKSLFPNDEKLFNLTFDSYIILLRTITQLCSFNSIDIIAKKNIKYFIELMTETINILKFNIMIEEEKIQKLNNIQGKYLYYFSYMDDIKFEINNLNTTLKNYLLNLERQEQGYIVSKESNFGSQIENLDSQEFLIFKKNSSILILKLIQELKNSFANESFYFNNGYFQKILKFYYKKLSLYLQDQEIALNLEIFENNLLNSLLTGYQINQDLTKTLDYHLIIDDFLFSQENTTNTNLEIIYRLLYFAQDIPLYKYYQIVQILVQFKPINNDYHEFFKLEIFDLTITRALQDSYSHEVEDILNKIYIYVNDYKISSHLLSVYSKIYLCLSLFYSTNQINLEKTKRLYSIFIQINGFDSLQNEYNDINIKILNNIKISPDLILNQFLETKYNELENEIINIKDKINTISNDEIKIYLASFITNNIFHGLSETFIFEDNQVLTPLDIGFEDYQMKSKKYIIRLIFTSLYKENFLEIFEDNYRFIENNIFSILDNLKDENKKFNILIDDEDEIEINY